MARTASPCRLCDLAPGQMGVIERVDLASAPCQRLAELGLLPGTPVRMLRRAPLGDPYEIQVRGSCLALRGKLCACVHVQAA